MSKYSQPEYILAEKLSTALTNPIHGFRALRRVGALRFSRWDRLRLWWWAKRGNVAAQQRIVLRHIAKDADG
jgi:hypothetical protein